MPAGVYSERFLSVATPGYWNYFTVPSGMRAVVRCISVVVFADPTAAAYVAAGPTYLMARPYPAPTSVVLGDFRVPFYPGEVIGCQVIGADTFCTVSGYLFSEGSNRVAPLPAPAPDPDWPPPPSFGELHPRGEHETAR